MRRSANVATPFTAVTVVVPERVAPGQGLALIAMVTVAFGTGWPDASLTVTWTAGAMATFPSTLAGGWVANTIAAGAAEMGSAATPAVPAVTATIATCPGSNAVTTPLESTLATLGFVLAQTSVTWLVMSVPVASKTRARN